jgi:hypothetical protein
MLQKMQAVLVWSSPAREDLIRRQIETHHYIPNCLGFVDGTHINLERAPGRGDAAGELHSRKKRCGFNVVAVVDHTKRGGNIH